MGRKRVNYEMFECDHCGEEWHNRTTDNAQDEIMITRFVTKKITLYVVRTDWLLCEECNKKLNEWMRPK